MYQGTGTNKQHGMKTFSLSSYLGLNLVQTPGRLHLETAGAMLHCATRLKPQPYRVYCQFEWHQYQVSRFLGNSSQGAFGIEAKGSPGRATEMCDAARAWNSTALCKFLCASTCPFPV